MSTDNRTTLNDCSAVFTGGDDTGAVITTTGSYYEGGSALSVQYTNADERSYTTTIGGTRDLSNSQCWLLVKDNLVQTQALGGIKYILYDGTNEIGSEIGGNDNTGLSLSTFWNSYRLDVSNIAVFTNHEFAGTFALLNLSAITGVGYGTQHLAKAVGSTDNCQIDRLSFITNGSPALTVNGGTIGTPETLTDVSADDITNGWGLVANPQGSQFNVFCSTEFGDSSTLDSYFEIAGAQVTLNGIGVGVGNFDMSVIANATGINSFKVQNSVLVNIGAKANWTVSTNIDTFELDQAQFVDNGNMTFPPSAAGRSVADSAWSGCGTTDISTLSPTNCNWLGSGQVDATNGGTLTNGSVKLSTATAGILTNDLAEVSNVDGESTGSNHHVELNSIGGGSMTWSCQTTGHDAGVTGSPVTPTATGNEGLYVNVATGTLTINVADGLTPPSIRSAGATVNVVAGQKTFTQTISPIPTPDYEYRLYTVTAEGSLDGSVEITAEGEERATTGSHSYTHSETNQPIAVQIISNDYVEKISYYTLTAADLSVTINLEINTND